MESLSCDILDTVINWWFYCYVLFMAIMGNCKSWHKVVVWFMVSCIMHVFSCLLVWNFGGYWRVRDVYKNVGQHSLYSCIACAGLSKGCGILVYNYWIFWENFDPCWCWMDLIYINNVWTSFTGSPGCGGKSFTVIWEIHHININIVNSWYAGFFKVHINVLIYYGFCIKNIVIKVLEKIKCAKWKEISALCRLL